MRSHPFHALVTLAIACIAGCYPDRSSSDGDADQADMSGYTDSDGDTISDADEGSATQLDTDGDGSPDYLDDDSDGDGWSDAEEAGDVDIMTPARDTDGDGTPDYRDEDSDANGIDDSFEGRGDLDDDGTWDAYDYDDDGDGCIDSREGSGSSTDSDDDGTPDFHEVDSDDDGIADETEGCLDDCDGDGLPNRVDQDSDGSGVGDALEGETDSDELSPYGSDDVADYCDPDNDGDGIDDSVEIEVYGTDPLLWDTDADGDFDYLEIVAGTDPLDPSSTLPGDLLIVGPTADPVDFTATTSIPRLDLALVAGTGGDLDAEIADLAADLPALLASIPVADLEVSIAVFEDFGAQGYGPSEGEPVSVLMPSTPDASTVATGLADLAARAALMSGAIVERASGVEAIYQVLTGEGLGSIIPHATCATSPLEPVRFGMPCLRQDAYTILAVLSDRLTWNGPGCLSTDTTCAYDPDAFPPMVEPHAYPESGGTAFDLGVRVLGVTADPIPSLSGEPFAWLDRFASDTSTVDGTGSTLTIDLGTDASVTAEAIVSSAIALATTSPFDAKASVIDLPDEPPQAEGSVLAYSLTALPMACEPPGGPWGACSFSSTAVEGVGPGVDVTIRLVFNLPTVNPDVDVLAFQVGLAVEERLVVATRRGYLIVPEIWDPEL